MNNQYEVLSPWAEADPISLRGISPRLTNMKGRKIGLFCNSKRVSKPLLTVVETKLKDRFPDSEIIWYNPNERYTNLQMEGKNKTRYEEWVKRVDAVIAATGD